MGIVNVAQYEAWRTSRRSRCAMLLTTSSEGWRTSIWALKLAWRPVLAWITFPNIPKTFKNFPIMLNVTFPHTVQSLHRLRLQFAQNWLLLWSIQPAPLPLRLLPHLLCRRLLRLCHLLSQRMKFLFLFFLVGECTLPECPGCHRSFEGKR